MLKSHFPGVIFCELVNELILKNQIPDFLPKIVSHDPTHEEKLHNITMALSEIKSMRTISIPTEIKAITIFDLMQVLANNFFIFSHLSRMIPKSLPLSNSSTTLLMINSLLSLPIKTISRKTPLNINPNSYQTLSKIALIPSLTTALPSLLQWPTFQAQSLLKNLL